MFLRARSLKSIRRSNLMITVYFLLTNMPEPIWRVLEHLRIVVSKQVVESWVKSHVKEIKSDESFLIVSFDNCSWNSTSHTLELTTDLHLYTLLCGLLLKLKGAFNSS